MIKDFNFDPSSINNYKESSLYLLEKINKDCGFFVLGKNLVYLVKSKSASDIPLNTTYLDFRPKININSIENDPSFESGNYDLLMLLDTADSELVDTFIRFCRIYSSNQSITFDDFIKSLINLFQLPKRQSKLDVIGTYGELSFLKAIYDEGIDLSSNWHINGSYSKYDFSSTNKNIEIKTSSTGDCIYKIKHNQIFNDENNIIVLVEICEAGIQGISLFDLINYFRNQEPFSKNIKLQIRLNEELKKEIDQSNLNKKYLINGFYGYKSSVLDTLKNIPLCINNINYDYEFDLTNGMKLKDIAKEIEK